jgi:hypothetical protein
MQKHIKKITQVSLLAVILLVAVASPEIREKIAKRFVASVATRGPASIQKVFDFSYLEGSALQAAAKDRLSSSISITMSEDKAKALITVGNFALKGELDQRDFACGFYDRLTLTFEAEGVSVDGEKPTLIISSGCEVGSNINYLEPISIPVTKLTQQTPSNTEFKFFDSRLPLAIKLVESPPEWPKKWVLRDLTLTHSKLTSRILNLSTSDLSSSRNHTISMNW